MVLQTRRHLIGSLALFVFAIASFAQIVVGRMLDKIGPKKVFLIVSAIQLVFFSLFIGKYDWVALIIALCFMLGAFGQIPINDFMIGKMAKSELRASIYGVRYIISFGVWAVVVPLISFIHLNYGFDSFSIFLQPVHSVFSWRSQRCPDNFLGQIDPQ